MPVFSSRGRRYEQRQRERRERDIEECAAVPPFGVVKCTVGEKQRQQREKEGRRKRLGDVDRGLHASAVRPREGSRRALRSAQTSSAR